MLRRTVEHTDSATATGDAIEEAERVSALEEIQTEVRERYAEQIGRGRGEVTTPALLLDLDRLRSNVATMAAAFAELPAALRPHVKVHKSPQIAHLELAAGAVGIACATAWEALVFADAGVHDILIANQVVQAEKISALMTAAAIARLTVAVDDARNVDALSQAASTAGVTLEVLIELDVGMGRCGVRTRDEALTLAEHVAAASAVTLRGMQGYEGHCMLEPDLAVRERETKAANAKLVDAVEWLEGHGHPCADVSAGGTGTYYITGANPRITEVQAGSYTLMDGFHGRLVPGDFENALTVAGTIISRQGRTVVGDVGRKSVGIDFVDPWMVGWPDAQLRYYAEEHCLFDFAGAPPLDLGDRIEIVAGYGPTTVNLHDAFLVLESDVVTDVWPVAPRGPGRPRR
jgi:D-serine deaminase-like pyridoxal phosphate-dependent protein